MIGNKEQQNKGIGTFAIREILKHAFMNMNLHRENWTCSRTIFESGTYMRKWALF